MVPGLVSFVVQIPVFLLQVELDPVVKTSDFCSRFCLSNKDMLESTGVRSGEYFSLEITQKIKHPFKTISLHNCSKPLMYTCWFNDMMIGRMFLHLTPCSAVGGRDGTRWDAAAS